MTTPPRLTSASGERMAAVAEHADALVDDGVPPAEAIAKAAHEHGLSVNHVPMVVRAFNTGRAVRQLAEADPWAKAAEYPTTTADEVVRHIGALTAPPVKAAAVADYALPPGGLPKPPAPPVLSVSSWTKAASAPVAAAPAPVRAPDRRLTQETDAALLFDRLRDELHKLSAEQYSAVKAAADRECPDAGAEVLAYVASYDAAVARKAAADRRPDPTVTTEHPAVALVKEIAAVRGAYAVPPDPRPLGYQKMARDATGTWYELRPAMPALDLSPPRPEPQPAPGLSIKLPEEKSAADEPQPKRTPFGQEMHKQVEGLNNYYYGKKDPLPYEPRTAGTTLGSLLNYGRVGTLSALANNNLTAPVLDVRAPSEDPDLNKQTKLLERNLDHLETQAAVQQVMQDPRLINADPHTVIGTYQTLVDLAPNVMKNQSVAGDLIHRRLQTGPLSAFDLKQLLDMEKAYVQSRKRNHTPDDDDD